MSYIQENILANETILKQAEMHWSIYISAAFLTVCSLSVIVVMIAFPPNGHDVERLIDSIILFLLAIGGLWLQPYIVQKTTELAVTNRRIILKKGIISRKTVELNLDKVESLTVDQGILGRIFNCGTLVVSGTGGVKATVKSIDDPLAFRKAVNEQIEETRVGPAR